MATLSSKSHILVIGAGIAGLACANYLQKKGCKVTILEARDRIGGRTWTDYSLGIPFDCGASLIHGLNHNPLADLAKQFNAEFAKFELSNEYILDQNNRLIPQAEVHAIQDEFHRVLKEAEQFAWQAKSDMTLIHAFEEVVEKQKANLKYTHTYPWQFMLLSLYAGNDKRLSARHWDESTEFERDIYLMLQGYAPIVNGLAQGCDIKLNTLVTHVIHDENGVQIKTQQGNFIADAVVITVPLGVLKNQAIEFQPSLPVEKQTSIQNLQMGSMNKIALQFPKAFWPPEYRYFTWLAERYNDVAFFVDYYHSFNQPLLVGLLSAELAKDFEKLNDQETIENVMLNLRKLFGNNIPKPERNLITRWNSDPFSQGSYSFVALGATGKDNEILAEPINNRVFFAGEATNRKNSATVHGAYLSGIREAERIIMDLPD